MINISGSSDEESAVCERERNNRGASSQLPNIAIIISYTVSIGVLAHPLDRFISLLVLCGRKLSLAEEGRKEGGF